MRLQPAAPRAHSAPPVSTGTTLRRRLANLLTLSLLGAPAFAAPALAAEPAEPAAAAETAAVDADAEGVVTLSDVRRTTSDAAVRPAGLLDCSDDCCQEPCATPCPPACDGGACGGACGAGGCRVGGGRGYGASGCPTCPGGVCPPGVPCPGVCLPGLCLPGVPCPGLCLPGVPVPGLCLPHCLNRCGGPESCYLCSLCGIGANANNGRHGLFGKYEHVYALNPDYRDRRTGDVWASQDTGVPMAVPLAPNVRHTMEYGWGLPSSRLVPISRPLPPSSLYGPPAGTTVELPTSHARHGKTLPYIPEHGQKGLPRTGVAFPRTIDNAGNR